MPASEEASKRMNVSAGPPVDLRTAPVRGKGVGVARWGYRYSIVREQLIASPVLRV